MPLITNGLPSRDGQDFHRAVKVQQAADASRHPKGKDSTFDNFEEYDDDDDDASMESDMEDLHRSRPANSPEAPALPRRSDKRASRMMDTVRLELKVLDGMKPKEGDRIELVQESDPHELYLSSEEDASLSDDYEDSLLDFDAEELEEGSSEPPTRTTSRRKSQEDTARVVSFMVAKPQIVNILHSNHNSPVSPESRHSVALDQLPSLRPSMSIQSNQSAASQPKPIHRRPSPLKLYPSSLRRLSVSSMAAPSQTPSTISQYSAPIHQNSSLSNLSTSLTPQQPRKSSRLGITTNLSSLASSARNSISHASHSFLSSDPFAQSPTVHEETEPAEPPKTPNSLANWRRGFSRTISKAATRKPSMPKISQSYTAAAVPPRPNTSAAIPTSRTVSMTLPAREYGMKRSETEPFTPTTAASQMSYEDVRRYAAKGPVPSKRENKKMSFSGLGRRNSIKGRDSRYT